ncbi:ribonuclease VapC [Deltaproteobacteria bacterium]|nr:ribonuclease VapC [Deltaproteobacteria bacterium]
MALVIDTGVLYAAMDRSDSAHVACRALLEASTEALVIPSAILPEVDYFVSRHLGPGAMVSLLRDIRRGVFRVENLEPADYPRVEEVIDRYADSDVGFVDAAVLAVVERLGEVKVATLDRRHFSMLRPRHCEALTLLP